MNVTRVVIIVSSLVVYSSSFASSDPIVPSATPASLAATKSVTSVTVDNSKSPTQSVQAVSLTTVTYVHTDVLGSVIAESNTSGTVTKTTDYKPFGESKDN